MTKRGNPSRGVSLVETAAAVAVSGLVIAAVLQSTVAVHQQSRRTDRRWIATCEAANLMEDVATWTWESLSPDAMATLKLSAETQRALPDAQLTARVTSPSETARVKHIELSLDWRDVGDQRVRPVRLVAARYQRGRMTDGDPGTSTQEVPR